MSTLPPPLAGHTAAFSPEFDTVYGIDREGRILSPDGLYAPTVTHDETADIHVHDSGWDALTGHTGQHGYSGAVMHPSEQWGRWAHDALCRLADAPEVAYIAFTVVVVNAPCEPDAPCFPDDPEHCQAYGCDAESAGWAVLYRGIEARV